MLTLVEGIERLETFFGQYLSQIIVSAIAPIAIFAYMVTLDIYIALIFLVFALATLAVPSIFHRWNRESSYRRRRSYGELGSDFLDSVQGLATLKSFGQSKQRGKELAVRAHDLYRSTMGVVAANSATSGTSILFMVMGAAVALAVGAVRVSNGEMELRPLLIVMMLGVEVFRPMRELVNLYHQGMTTLSSAQSVFGILDAPVTIVEPESVADRSLPEIIPEMAFDGVTFGYENGYRSALDNVSFELRQGETLGVVGASGAGKSTLVWLMYRFYDPQEGAIRTRWSRPARTTSQHDQGQHFGRHSGHVSFSWDGRRQSAIRETGCYADRTGGCGTRRECARVHHAFAAGLRDGGGRTCSATVGRSASEVGDRAGIIEECSNLAVG